MYLISIDYECVPIDQLDRVRVESGGEGSQSIEIIVIKGIKE